MTHYIIYYSICTIKLRDRLTGGMSYSEALGYVIQVREEREGGYIGEAE